MTVERMCFATEQQRCQKETTVHQKVPWFRGQQEVLQDPLHQSADHFQLLNRSTGLRIIVPGDKSIRPILSHSSVLKLAPDLPEWAIDISLSLHRRSGVG